MFRVQRSFASKLISAFATSVLFAVYIEVMYPDSGGDYGSLFLPAFFIAFAFVTIIAFPVSLLADKMAKSVRRVTAPTTRNALVSGAALATGIGALILFGSKEGSRLALYGLVLLYGYFTIDYLVSLIESKYRRNNDLF
jgi:hypothetical protein